MNNGIKLCSVVKQGHLGGYESGGDPNTWYPHLWNWMIKELKINSIIDVGCGEGHSTKYFKDLGCDILGIEGSSDAIRDSKIYGNIIQHDYCLGSFLPDKLFDAVWCCEFVEHMEERYINNFLKTFTASKEYIFMTHALPGQSGWHHVNCRPDSYWIEAVSKVGFRYDRYLTIVAKVLSKRGYFSRSGIVFVKDGVKVSYKFSLIFYLKYIFLKIKNYFVDIFVSVNKCRNKLALFFNQNTPKLYFLLRKIRDKIFKIKKDI